MSENDEALTTAQEPPFDDLDPVGIRAACAEAAIACMGGDNVGWSEIRESVADIQPLVAQLRQARAEVQRLSSALAAAPDGRRTNPFDFQVTHIDRYIQLLVDHVKRTGEPDPGILNRIERALVAYERVVDAAKAWRATGWNTAAGDAARTLSAAVDALTDAAPDAP